MLLVSMLPTLPISLAEPGKILAEALATFLIRADILGHNVHSRFDVLERITFDRSSDDTLRRFSLIPSIDQPKQGQTRC